MNEDKIEVGEFVRTDDGYIAKLIERDIEDEDVKDGMLFDNYIHKDHKQMRESGIKKCCKKHSKNIIDLIEVGDYVNGIPIVHKLKDGRIQLLSGYLLSNEDIKKGDNIVTKEQFESLEYKV